VTFHHETWFPDWRNVVRYVRAMEGVTDWVSRESNDHSLCDRQLQSVRRTLRTSKMAMGVSIKLNAQETNVPGVF
jgi:hypothetical protein